MATNLCANRPPQSSQPGPNRGTPNPQPNTATGIPNLLPQGPQHVFPGMYTSQDYQPGPPCTSHPHTHIPPHPFMYIPPATHPHPQPPPMPPFLQYQWPMPYSYNPFSGFPAMGYGMLMPPFPPNPYLEAPGYMLPQPHPQQMNYRRFIHTQFPAASAPYQSQNQNRRFWSQHNSAVRETVSSEVQTEPAQSENASADGSPLPGSESGNGTKSSTPSPSGSIGEKQSQAVVENYTTAASDTEGNLQVAKKGSSRCTAKRGQGTPLSAQIGKKSRVGQESSFCKCGSDTNAEMWSMCTSGSIIPVCSSSDQEDKVSDKERWVSFPDILMSGVGETPQVVTPEFSDKPLPKREDRLAGQEVELAKEITCNSLMTKSKTLEDDYVDTVFSPKERESLRKIIRLPFYFRETRSATSNTLTDPLVLVDSIVTDIHSRNGMSQNTPIDSPNQSRKVPDNELAQDDYEDSSLHEENTDTMQDPVSSYLQFRRKMDESVWSVESLAAYVPSQDWLTQNGLFDPEVTIEEILEDFQKSASSTQSCYPTHSRDGRLSRRFSFSANAFPMYIPSASWSADQHNLNHSNTFPLSTQQDVDTSAPAETINPHICEMGPKLSQTLLSKEKQLQSDHGMDPSNALVTSILQEVNLDETTLDVGEAVDMDGSSETVPSLNQEPCRVTKWKGIGPCSSEQVEAPVSNSLMEKSCPSSSPKSLQIREREQELNGRVATNPVKSEQLAVDIQKHDAVSPSKSDCGSQCTVLQNLNCACNCHNEDDAIQATSETPEGHQKQPKKNRPYRRRNRQRNCQKEPWMGGGVPGKSKGLDATLL